MGETIYKKDIENLFKKSPIVSLNSIDKIVKNKGNSKNYTKRIINYLLKKGEIKRITRGYYTNRDEATLAVFCFKPAYLGLQDALSFHNLWEQETNPIIITINNVRQGRRGILGRNVIIKRITKKYFFGIEYYPYENIALPYSDIEKTFIDMNHFRLYMDKEVINAFKEKINRKKLIQYLKFYPLKFRKTVLKKLKG
jgi:predicted transcriptional regulator of viral defense system